MNEGILLGISTFREGGQGKNLWRMPALPVAGKLPGYAINRRDRAESD